MITFRYEWGTPLYVKSVELRDKVLRKPLGLVFAKEDLILEQDYFHFGLINECNDLLACLYLKKIDENVLQLKQMAVSPLIQQKGLGSKLIHGVEEFGSCNNYSEIVLHARESAIGSI